MELSLKAISMLKKQEILADQYKYKPLPPLISLLQRQEYEDALPDFLKNLDSYNRNIFSLTGVLIANKFERIVIGDYGAFVEISDDDIIKENICIKPGEEYRINEPRYSEHVKYFWYEPKEGYKSKLYFQQKTVDYADYKPGFWYVSPYEIIF